MSPPKRFQPGYDPPARSRDTALLFAVRGMDLLVPQADGPLALLRGAAVPELAASAHFLGVLDDTDCYAVPLPADFAPPEGMKTVPARSLYKQVDEVTFAVAGRAVSIAEWEVNHRFCGRCGTATQLVAGERARRCPVDHTPFYPRISPAVIVLITRGDQMLLARNATFPEPFFSTVAGFVDPGESLEETVLREVKEEVGVDLKDLTYFGSQPWPFGRSLMVGFMAEYAGGDITVDGKEIAEARWFDVDDLPRIPPRLSIARHLIDTFIDRVKARRGLPPG
ncbi:NAD(+) diphosphatase [Corallococcus llansteffanensis]|uniref:NAD(+) diphosphatase n=1 Tax=Corallococcus llansteffanensis TaxID=2316731 RepID=A0A3A8NSF2_9BACT|nr:NAD(+) diphosphatase [Corallococcus llansteffanensis]RKH42364.1 NAD(+) diphosphatase [Corallococcus llansteffanensis]